MTLKTRLRKLEESAQQNRRGPFVVSGSSRAEHRQKMDALIAAGTADPQSLFVCIKKFAGETGAAAEFLS